MALAKPPLLEVLKVQAKQIYKFRRSELRQSTIQFYILAIPNHAWEATQSGLGELIPTCNLIDHALIARVVR